MSSKKRIQINPDFFKIGSKGKTRKKEKRQRVDIRASIKPSNIKKKLMDKIKEHQQLRLNQEQNKNTNKDANKFAEDFNKQINYLEKIISNKKEKKQRRKKRTRVHAREVHAPPRKFTSIRDAVEPPYGCLRNASKPTYSEWKKTLKKHREIKSKQPIVIGSSLQSDQKISAPISNDLIKSRQHKLNQLKVKFREPQQKKINMRSHLRTVKIYKLGKNRKQAKVGVLIKSGKTRKLVKNEQTVLRKRCLSEVKQYLRKHNLIKVGSSAPEDVLRRLYEDSFLAGNIFNRNPENLLYNYLNDDIDK